MHKFFVETDNLNTISDCLNQLVNAEEAQLSIEDQLVRSNSSSDWSSWRKKAENALRLIKGKRRIITSRLAVLRHEEKERNMQLHQQHNDFLVQALREIVTPSSLRVACVWLKRKWRRSMQTSSEIVLLVPNDWVSEKVLIAVTGLKPGTILQARKECWMVGREYVHVSPDGNRNLPASACTTVKRSMHGWPR